jgi:hypothetical protein
VRMRAPWFSETQVRRQPERSKPARGPGAEPEEGPLRRTGTRPQDLRAMWTTFSTTACTSPSLSTSSTV